MDIIFDKYYFKDNTKYLMDILKYNNYGNICRIIDMWCRYSRLCIRDMVGDMGNMMRWGWGRREKGRIIGKCGCGGRCLYKIDNGFGSDMRNSIMNMIDKLCCYLRSRIWGIMSNIVH